MSRWIITLFLICLTGAACSKTGYPEANGIVKDFTGLDGCSLMIELDSGERLEPVSLPPNTTLIAGRRVLVKYNPVLRASICIAGTTAEITYLQYL